MPTRSNISGMDRQPTEIVQVASEAEIAVVRSLLREYISWVMTLDADSACAPTFEGLEVELAALPGIYARPSGRMLLAVHEGKAAGCICLKPYGPDTCEVKRFYVRPEMRGRAIGSLLMTRVMEEARLAGYKRIVLDSHVSMKTAHAIYEANGFRKIPVPPDFPENLKAVAIFMECILPVRA